MSGVKFIATSFGPGSMVRFKSLKSHRWEYAIYRGVEKNERGQVTCFTYSDTPLGPITRWLMYWPEFMECAVTEAGSTDHPWPCSCGRSFREFVGLWRHIGADRPTGWGRQGEHHFALECEVAS